MGTKQPFEERIALLLVLQAAEELGPTNSREIGELLELSHHTIRNHWNEIMDEFQVKTRHEAQDEARRRGLVHPKEPEESDEMTE